MAIVTFDRRLYEVQETSRRLTVCLSVVSPADSCPVNTSFSVDFFVLEGNASNTPLMFVCLVSCVTFLPANPEDYEASTLTTIEFSRCSRRQCAPSITIINDTKFETDEFFEIIIVSRNQDLVRTSPSSATVSIQDDSASE